MKKRLLLIWLMITSAACFLTQAQTWTAPTLKGSTLATGTTYYVYNVGSSAYLNRGAWWGTMAAVSAKPTANADASTIIKWTAVNTVGSTWTFQYNSNGSDVSNNYLFATGTGGDVFTDNTTDDTWNVVLTDATTNTYSIQVVSTFGGYNSTQYLGSASASEWTNKGNVGVYTVRFNRASGDNYTQWKFVSQTDMDLYNARILLDRYMNYAKTRGGIDISSYITTYNAGVTADINSAAASLLTTLGRTDVTSSITNPSFETAAQAGWTNSGGFANQTNTPLFTKDGTNYTEKWTSSSGGSSLGTGTITQTVTGLANGLYGLVAAGHAVQQEGGNPLHTGAFFKAGTDSTEISAGGDYNVDYALVSDATSGSNGTLTIGFALSGAVGCNWTGFDNFRLYYYGPIVVPTIVTSVPYLAFDELNAQSIFTVSGANLTDSIRFTVPSGYSVSPKALGPNASNDTVTVTFSGAAESRGFITATSGTTTSNIRVVGLPNSTTYTPLYSSGNLVTDPYFNSLSTYGGWGSKSIVTDTTLAYSGIKCAKISGASECSASIDYTLTGKISANKNYRLKAMVKSDAAFFFTLNNCGINGSTADYQKTINTSGVWQALDFYFNTGTLAGSDQFLWMNSCPNGSNGAKLVYLDNLEIYQVGIMPSLSSLTYFATGITKTFTVSSRGLHDSITITAPAGFNVSPVKLDSIVNGTTVSVTFNGAISTTGYVLLTSGTYKDSVKVTASLEPTLTVTETPLIFDDLNTTATFKVTGGNLTDSIRFTLPSGYSVSPSVLGMNVIDSTITVTFNGAAESKGFITVTGGTLSANVRVIGTLNPAPVAGNLIADPYFNDNTLGTYQGWGSRLITTDTTEVYSGIRSYKTIGTCGGSLDYSLLGKVESNTTYRLRVNVNTTGKYKFMVHDCGVTGQDASLNYLLDVNTNGNWVTYDTTFTTGTIGSSPNLYFNSCEGYDGTLAYLDNYVVTILPSIIVTPSTLSFSGKGTKSITVSGSHLSSDITITAPAGFTVTPSTLSKDTSGATVSVAYDGIAKTDAYIYLTSGSVKDSVHVAGVPLVPSISVTPKSLTFAGAGTKTFAATGKNLSDSITITAPAGFKVSPASLATNASAASVYVTFDGIAAKTGYVYLTSGTTKDSVSVSATITGIETADNELSQFVYVQNDQIHVTFGLAQTANVQLSVYNLNGSLLFNQKGIYVAGTNHVVLDAANLSSGIYIVNMVKNGKSLNFKVVK